ncbi:hypothetical protein BDBG_05543 [Blastomyces gilchristii SLH14081]|uniref:INO80 complex subunit B-like conserved region domain-containing protein n=1 Tax=Blastomyces gilchristii (strain SLH14081) TaxID=559298 RepID=A0A179URK6_BLAGS|nr:uncharacterized protein BDBG_05543 [Blastomyces gilchristii SLH14081]OAT09838.1 hypothetical protein BDBG_05543 [Blastomyces gilchristii SLH14081]
MADRPLTRARQQSDRESSYYQNTETASTSSSDDWQAPTPSQSEPSRFHRVVDETPSSPSVTVSRLPPSPPKDTNRSIRLKVKMPSSKLREVTSGPEKRHHNIFTEPVIVTGPRNSRSKKTLVEVDTDEDEDLDESMNEDGEEESNVSDADGTDGEVDPNESEDEDADADAETDPDADGDDVDMDDAPPISPSAKQAAARPTVTVTPAGGGRLKNTDTNMDLDDDDDDDDEELSELDSDADADGEPDETAVPDEPSELVEDEEIEEEEDEEEEEEDEEEVESDSGTPITASRASTPDVTKMTKRQRGRMELGGDFLQLPMEPQVKKHLTAEEHAMRRAEMARRRKNLSEKRNEEEKMDTINKLLKKQAPKRRGKISAAETAAAGDTTPRTQEPQEPEKPDPIMIRYVSNRDGRRVGVPEEWFGTPAGRIFGNMPTNRRTEPSRGHRLVEEV